VGLSTALALAFFQDTMRGIRARLAHLARHITNQQGIIANLRTALACTIEESCPQLCGSGFAG